jgi:hypothetical protein
MQWDQFVDSMSHLDRARLVRWLNEGRQYARLADTVAAQGGGAVEIEEIVRLLDQAVDALTAARVMLPVPAAPQPWEDQTYRAYQTFLPATRIRLRPADLTAVREAVGRKAEIGQRGIRGPAPVGALRSRNRANHAERPGHTRLGGGSQPARQDTPRRSWPPAIPAAAQYD